MSTQTTSFLCNEIIRIHDNLYANGRPKYSPEQQQEQREELIDMALELAERVARGELKDRQSALEDWL